MKLRHNHQGKTSIRFGDIGGVMIPMQAGLDQNTYSRLLLNQTFMKTLICSMILQLGIKTTSSMCFIGQITSAKSCHRILKSRHLTLEKIQLWLNMLFTIVGATKVILN